MWEEDETKRLYAKWRSHRQIFCKKYPRWRYDSQQKRDVRLSMIVHIDGRIQYLQDDHEIFGFLQDVKYRPPSVGKNGSVPPIPNEPANHKERRAPLHCLCAPPYHALLYRRKNSKREIYVKWQIIPDLLGPMALKEHMEIRFLGFPAESTSSRSIPSLSL